MNVTLKHKHLNLIFALFVIAFATRCKSAEKVIAAGTASNALSAKQVIKQHQKMDAKFKTLQAKVRIDMVKGEKEQGIVFNFRMEKDKTIWLSAPFATARMMLTPEKVQFYNTLENEYFDGNYKLISNFVGLELDFNKVQNILLGQAVYSLNDKPYKVSTNENKYVLEPKNQKALLELFYLINPSHFKMNSFQLAQNIKKRFLQVDYLSYQDVKKQIIPKDIKIIAVEDKDEFDITLDFRSVSLDKPIRFPFKMPSGYKEIVVK